MKSLARSQSGQAAKHGPTKGGPKNERGQAIVEYILLMVVLFGVFTAIIDFLKEQEFMTKFTQGPWITMNGMIQCGNWQACGVETPVGGVHPNSNTRVLSLDPETSL